MRSTNSGFIRFYRYSLLLFVIVFGVIAIVASGGGGDGGDGDDGDGNGDGNHTGSAPVISNLTYSPKSTAVGSGKEQNVTISGLIDFVDNDGDVSILTVDLFDPDNNRLSTNTSTLEGASGLTSGSVAGEFYLSTSVIAEYSFQVYVTDETNLKSNVLTGYFSVKDMFQPRLDLDTVDGPSSVAVGDLHGDGYPNDIAVANWRSNSVSVILSNGDGTFTTRADYPLWHDYLRSVAVGDFNGDSAHDLAVVSGWGVSVLLNKGYGTFADWVDYLTGGDPESVAIGDVDGWGHPDLVVTNLTSNNVSVLLNNGWGTFGSKADYDTGNGTRCVAVGDLNGDNFPDLAVARDYPGATVSVLLNNGDGTFAAKTDYVTGYGAYSVAIGDLDGDGYPDMALSIPASESVSVFLNNGDGTFATAVNYGAGDHPYSVAVGDFNGDSYLDLAAANYDADSVSVLLNKGDGTFAAKVDYQTGGGPCSIAVGDLDGDGDPDLVVANSLSDTISILLNNLIN